MQLYVMHTWQIYEAKLESTPVPCVLKHDVCPTVGSNLENMSRLLDFYGALAAVQG